MPVLYFSVWMTVICHWLSCPDDDAASGSIIIIIIILLHVLHSCTFTRLVFLFAVEDSISYWDAVPIISFLTNCARDGYSQVFPCC